jgi:hypothetical protein
MFADRNRAGATSSCRRWTRPCSGQFFFVTMFVQDILGYSPLRADFSFLPVTAAIVATSQFAARSMPRLGPRRLMTTGALLAVVRLAWLTQVSVTSGYLDGILGPMVLFGLGIGLLFVSLTIVAVSGVEPTRGGCRLQASSTSCSRSAAPSTSPSCSPSSARQLQRATQQMGQFLSTAPPDAQA